MLFKQCLKIFLVWFLVQLHSSCVVFLEEIRVGGWRTWISFLQISHYLGLYVNYKGTLGLDRMFTCLLRFPNKSLKDNDWNGMFIKTLKKSRRFLSADRLVALAALHLGALLLRSLLEHTLSILDLKANQKRLCWEAFWRSSQLITAHSLNGGISSCFLFSSAMKMTLVGYFVC